MPKISKSDEEVKSILLKGTIKKRMEAKGLTDMQMAICTGMAEGTFEQKKLHPKRFKYPELVRLMKKLEFTDAEKLEVL